MEKKSYFHLVGTEPKPGKDEEYNAWYDEHVTLLFEFEGLEKVTRVHLDEPYGPNGEKSPQNMTIYEFEKREDFVDFCNSPVMEAANKHYDSQGKPVSEIYWAGGYESVTVLER